MNHLTKLLHQHGYETTWECICTFESDQFDNLENSQKQ